MSVGSAGLLRLLAGGVRPPGAPDPAPTDQAGPFDFAAALDAAQHGRLRSGAPVRVPASLAGAVDDALRETLSAGADAAAASGLGRVLIDAGTRSFRLDVAARTVIDAPDRHARVVDDIDGLVRAHGAEPAADAPARAGPARVVRNASLLRVLADPPGAP